MKKTLCVLLSLLLLLGMTSLAQADEAMTLRLWVRYDDDFSACIADFEALHPGVKIIQEQVGNNYDDLLAKYNTGMQSNDMPNIGVTGQRNGIPQLYDAGWLLPIENYLTAKEMDDVVENFWTRYTYDGKRMSMPFSCTIPGCYVNLTMLHELGYENMPETLDELCEMARKLKNGAEISHVIHEFETQMDCMEVILGPYSLKQMKKSGRISAAAAVMGELMGVRPIITLIDGKTKVESKVRGDDKVVPAMIELCKKRADGVENFDYMIGHTNIKQAEDLEKACRKAFGKAPLVVFELGGVVSANTGPDTVALVYTGHPRG